jgi:hypothetical protein
MGETGYQHGTLAPCNLASTPAAELAQNWCRKPRDHGGPDHHMPDKVSNQFCPLRDPWDLVDAIGSKET